MQDTHLQADQEQADQKELPQLLTFKETMRLYGFRQHHLRRLCQERLLNGFPAIKDGRKWMIRRRLIEPWLDEVQERGEVTRAEESHT